MRSPPRAMSARGERQAALASDASREAVETGWLNVPERNFLGTGPAAQDGATIGSTPVRHREGMGS